MARAPRPPGPRGLPLAGNLFDSLRDPLAGMVEGKERYGDVVRFRIATYETWLLSAPEDIQYVLQKNYKNYHKSPFYRALGTLLGNGLVHSEGEFWRRQRRMIQPAFVPSGLERFVHPMVRCSAEMLREWRQAGETPLDLTQELGAVTFRIVGQTLFSTDWKEQAAEAGAAVEYANHFLGTWLGMMPPWIPTISQLKFRRARRRLDAFVYDSIDARKASGKPENDLLQLLLTATDEDDDTGMTVRQLRDELMTLALAGHETTATALTWTWYLLAQHRSVQERLRAEAEQALGDRDPLPADVANLPYTEQVIQESMRLYPPVWGLERQAVEADEVAGYFVKPKTGMAVCPYILHRDRRFWEDPERFDPDRFRPEQVASRPAYTYLPFGAGPRMCIGNHFAMTEMKILVAMMARAFHLELATPATVTPRPSVTLRPRGEIRVFARPHRAPVGRRPVPSCG